MAAMAEVRQAMEGGEGEAARVVAEAQASAQSHSEEEEAIARSSQSTLASCAEAVQASRASVSDLIFSGQSILSANQPDQSDRSDHASSSLVRSERAAHRLEHAITALSASKDSLELINASNEKSRNGNATGALHDATRSERTHSNCVPLNCATDSLLKHKSSEAKDRARRAADGKLGQWLVDARNYALRAGEHAAESACLLRERRQRREEARENVCDLLNQSDCDITFPADTTDPDDEKGIVLLPSSEGPSHSELVAALDAYAMLERGDELRSHYWQQRIAQLDWRLHDVGRADLLKHPASALDASVGFFMLEVSRGIASESKVSSALERSAATLRSACEAALKRAEHSRDLVLLAERLSLHCEALTNVQRRATPLVAALSSIEWRHIELCEACAERKARQDGVSGIMEGCEAAHKSGEALRRALGRRYGPPDGQSSRQAALRAAVERAMLPEITDRPDEWIETALELIAITNGDPGSPAAQLLEAAEAALAAEAAGTVLDAFSAYSDADLCIPRPPGGPRSEAVKAAKEAAKRCKSFKATAEVSKRVCSLAAEKVSLGALASIAACKRINGAGAQMLDGELGRAEAELVGDEYGIGARALLKALATGEVTLASPVARNIDASSGGVRLISECVHRFIETMYEEQQSHTQRGKQPWYWQHQSHTSNRGNHSHHHHQKSSSSGGLSLEDAEALLSECDRLSEHASTTSS
jgi:hypothetical protein